MSREQIALSVLQSCGVSGFERLKNGRLYAECPGKRLHTGANQRTDFELHLNGAPTGTCFHNSCSEQVQSFNSRLRSEIGKAESTVKAQAGGHLDWDTVIGPTVPVADRNFVEEAEIPAPGRKPSSDLRHYLATLFKRDEVVAYVTTAKDHEGKFTPQGRGTYIRTAGQILDALDKGATVEEALSATLDPQAGAWCRLNPFDGAGVADANVTEYRHALVESDGMTLDRQLAIMRSLHLPAALVVSSGGKSLHAVVRIDAGKDLDLYKTRVNDLYTVLKQNGFEVDHQNRNPSRLSRMPGVDRNGKPQYIVAENIGAVSWDEWIKWRNEIDDKLPAFENMGDLVRNPPPLAPELIEGVLRQGHKMLLSGPSKAGKSFALIYLCVAIANGAKWIGMTCRKGRVLYVNMELDRASGVKRFADVCHRLALPTDGVDVWNLRGHGCGLGELAPKLVRRMAGTKYSAVVVDPIYKLLTGDENSNADMALFCNHLDKIGLLTGASVIVASHFSKGTQGHKSSIDRTAGAGVFGRDPDAILTLSELEGVEDQGDGSPYLVEFTLREFARAATKRCWFKYPVHVEDASGRLDDQKVPGAPGRKAKGTTSDLVVALASCEFKGIENPTVQNVLDEFNSMAQNPVTDDTIRNWAKKLKKDAGWTYSDGQFWRTES